MKGLRNALAFVIALLGACSAAHALPDGIEGYWKGAINAGGSELTICFDIKISDDGYAATLDVPQQGAYGIECLISFDGLNVNIEMNSLRASFNGLHFMGNISGNFTQNGLTLPLALKKGEREPKAQRPQDPKGPFPYIEEEVRFHSQDGGLTLAGTLTLPEGGTASTAVVLVSGSGTQDRNEEIYGHKPFAVIADRLSRNGIAVFRYDDRGAGESESGQSGATTLNYSLDALGAVEMLRGRGFVKVGVIGHSEGGLIALMLASQGKADFIVTLAGPMVKGSDLLDAQRRAIYSASGYDRDFIEANAALMSSISSLLDKADKPEDALTGISALLEGAPEDQKETVIRQALDPWMFWFQKYDPTEDIVATRCPALALNGDRDSQVVASQNITALEAICSEHGKTNFTTVVLPHLNHLFQHCSSGLPGEYSQISETISEEVLDLMTEFVQSAGTSSTRP